MSLSHTTPLIWQHLFQEVVIFAVVTNAMRDFDIFFRVCASTSDRNDMIVSYLIGSNCILTDIAPIAVTFKNTFVVNAGSSYLSQSGTPILTVFSNLFWTLLSPLPFSVVNVFTMSFMVGSTLSLEVNFLARYAACASSAFCIAFLKFFQRFSFLAVYTDLVSFRIWFPACSRTVNIVFLAVFMRLNACACSAKIALSVGLGPVFGELFQELLGMALVTRSCGKEGKLNSMIYYIHEKDSLSFSSRLRMLPASLGHNNFSPYYTINPLHRPMYIIFPMSSERGYGDYWHY